MAFGSIAKSRASTQVSIFRPENGEWLRAELAGRKLEALPEDGAGAAWAAWRGSAGAPPSGVADPLIFEQQRLTDAHFITGGGRSQLAGQALDWLLPEISRAAAPRVLHVFTLDAQGRVSLSGRAAAFKKALLRAWANAGPSALALSEPAPGSTPSGTGTAVQMFLPGGDGLWCALHPAAQLVSPFVGGVSTLRLPAEAPSRSILKLLEAWLVCGWSPRPRERVVDLGAAPGGWSLACLERGCRVVAVDNGPLKLPGPEARAGDLTHLRADGLAYRPPPAWLPVDWLLSDMLIPPGVCLGLLKKWIGGGWMRRFIVNVKLPQREPLVALEPVRAFLAGVPGLQWRLRQLYHDRREVTVMGEMPTAPPSLHPGGKPARPGRPPRVRNDRNDRKRRGGHGRRGDKPGKR